MHRLRKNAGKITYCTKMFEGKYNKFMFKFLQTYNIDPN